MVDVVPTSFTVEYQRSVDPGNIFVYVSLSISDVKDVTTVEGDKKGRGYRQVECRDSSG